MRKLLCAGLLFLWSLPVWCAQQEIQMASMFEEAGQTLGVPAALPQAIARVESGCSPWMLNIEGRGYKFDSKEKALEKAQEAQASGRSFDSGVMQVNNSWLKKYGIPLEAAFDPAANIYLGSWILKQEIARHGQNWKAVGAYHSSTPAKSRAYAEMVKAALAKGPVSKKAEHAVPAQASAPKTDPAPLVVARRGQQTSSTKINQPGNDSAFVKRLNRGEL